MKKIIEKCFKEYKIASFYFDKEDNCKHLTGFIHQYNESELLIAHITPRGEYDGYILNSIDNLYRIEFDGEYETKIERLYKLKNQKHSSILSDGHEIALSLLKFAYEQQHLVSLELSNDTITGLVEMCNDFIHLLMINDNGKENGKCVIDLNEIVTIECDTDYEQDLKILRTMQSNE